MYASRDMPTSNLEPGRAQDFHPASGVNLSASSTCATTKVSHHHVNGIPTDDARDITSVLVWPYSDYGAGTAELKHFAENGIRESPFLQNDECYLSIQHTIIIIQFGLETLDLPFLQIIGVKPFMKLYNKNKRNGEATTSVVLTAHQ